MRTITITVSFSVPTRRVTCVFLRLATRVHFLAQGPCLASIVAYFVAPTEGLPRNFGEDPTRRLSGGARPFLHDFIAPLMGYKNVKVVIGGAHEDDVPCIDLWVIIPERCPHSPFGAPGFCRSSRPGMIHTSWIARPSSTQPQCHSPLVLTTCFPFASQA